jgi:Flp pilus assembly pilin Flp
LCDAPELTVVVLTSGVGGKSLAPKTGSIPVLTRQKEGFLRDLLEIVWSDEGQDIAEYAVMLAVILVVVIGTIRLIGSNANNAFSSVASSIH